MNHQKLETKDLIKQFILCKEKALIPAGWKVRETAGWLLGNHQALSITEVVGRDDSHLGYLLGTVITQSGQVSPQKIVWDIASQNKQAYSQSVESNLYDLAGSFIGIFINPMLSRVYLDSMGSLAAVYALENPVVAATTSLIESKPSDWHKEFIKTPGNKNASLWFPFGLTNLKTAHRLLPNHYLDLDQWEPIRHWPKRPEDIAKNSDTASLINIIFDTVQRSISAFATEKPTHFSLTAGQDSRMVLAAALQSKDNISFFTIDNQTFDVHIARRLAKQFDLEHCVLKKKVSTPEGLARWLYNTGYCTDEDNGRAFPTLEGLANKSDRFINGLVGEVGRCFYWRKGDTAKTAFTLEELLMRMRLPAHPQILDRGHWWLDGVSAFNDVNSFDMLDLLYLENRLGGWASPNRYGGVGDRCLNTLTPLSHRRVVEAMLQLPTDYRWQQKLSLDMCRVGNPALLKLPINDFVGPLKYPARAMSVAKKAWRIATSSRLRSVAAKRVWTLIRP